MTQFYHFLLWKIKRKLENNVAGCLSMNHISAIKISVTASITSADDDGHDDQVMMAAEIDSLLDIPTKSHVSSMTL